MNKPKHTPGPWVVEFNQSMPNQFIVNSTVGGRVAYIAPQADAVKQVGDRLEAINAHLIAAAPELLEALEAMVKQFVDSNATESDLLQYHGGIVYHVILAARATIAKAKGE